MFVTALQARLADNKLVTNKIERKEGFIFSFLNLDLGKHTIKSHLHFSGVWMWDKQKSR